MAAGSIVVKIGGSALEDGGAEAGLALARLVCEIEAPVVVVHGGGAEITRRLDAIGAETRRVDGLRVTPDEHIEEVVAAVAGVVNTKLVGTLRAAGVQAAGLTLQSAGFACQKLQHPSGDLGRVGEVVGGAGAVTNGLLDAGATPVLSCIGADAAGGPLNINGDDAAAGVASVLGASTLLLLSDVAGVLNANGQPIGELDESAVEALVTSGVISGGMGPKVRAALAVSGSAGCPVVIAHWREADAAGRGLAGTRVRARRSAEGPHHVSVA
ncbi:MAG: acetylglutamate kinase [Planctomycetota bacterium]